MYFLTVFVLLLTFKFIHLQPVLIPAPQDAENIIPFGFDYTEEIDEFLKIVIKNFSICPLEKLKMYLQDFLENIKNNSGNEDLCKTKEIPTQPFFILESETCKEWCRQNNAQFVIFLNNNTEIIKNSFFMNGQDYILVLNPTDSAGHCVEDKRKKKYHCSCDVKYNITVNRAFYVSFLSILYRALSQDNTLNRTAAIIKSEEFSALAILLKFYPQSAVFYLAYLFYKYDEPLVPAPFAVMLVGDKIVIKDDNADNVLLQPSQYIPIGVIINGVHIQVTRNGMVEDRGTTAAIGDNGIVIQIFMRLYELIVSGSCDLRTIGKNYYMGFLERTSGHLILCVAVLLLCYSIMYATHGST